MAGRRRYYKRKLYFSTQDRILLHLLDFVGYEDNFHQPDDLTQFGIANAIGLGRSTVSKAIRRLHREKLVRGVRAHVPSGKLRRTVYLLTTAGVTAATQRKREVEEEIIALREKDGRERALRMAELPNLLPEYATLLDVATHVSEGVFDLGTFQGRRSGRFIDLTENLPRLRYFFGREAELESVDAWLESETEKVLVISGITGIGKTTLLSRKLDEWRGKRHLYFHRLMQWTTLRNVVQQLAEFLTRLSKRQLLQYLEAKPDIDIELIVSMIREDLDGVPVVFVFDDYHNAKLPIRNFFVAFRTALEALEGPRLIVAGRNVTPFYDRREVRVKRVVRELPLMGLDPTSSAKILQVRNLPLSPEALHTLHQRTGGHPLFLELVDSEADEELGDIHKYLEEEMFARVTESEATVLNAASVFRRPVHSDALFVDETINKATIRSLVEQSLLREVSARVYEVHDVVGTFFLEMMSPRDRRRYHHWAAQHYMSGAQPEYLEALFHYVHANEMMSATRLAVKEGRAIVREGESEELFRLVERMLPAAEDPAHSAELRMLEANILNVRGELDRAVGLYEEILRLSPEPALQPKVAEAHRSLGDIHRRRGNVQDAEAHLESALKLYRAMDDGEGQAATFLAMGSLIEDRGDFARAQRLYERAVDLARAHGHPALEADGHFAISRVFGARGDLVASLERKREALTIAEGIADWHLQAKFQVSLGAILQQLGELEDSMQYYEQAIETARRIGDLRMLGYGLWNAAGLRIARDELLRAESALREADGLFKKLREPLMEALVVSCYGVLWEKRGKWQVAKQNLSVGLDLLKRGGHDWDFARYSINAAHLFHKNGETGRGLALLQDALAVGRRLKAKGITQEAQHYIAEYSSAVPSPPKAKRSRDAIPTTGS